MALDIVGVVLLFRYGLPAEIRFENVMEFDESWGSARRRRRYAIASYLALALLVLGFFLQIVSNHVEGIIRIWEAR